MASSSVLTILYVSVFFALNLSPIRLVSSSTCLPQSVLPSFLYDLQEQCPLSISASRPVQMKVEALEKVLISKSVNSYSALLFYGSWCPFSSSMRDTFDMLSSLYPEVEHLEVEQLSVMPSVLSRYGIHSVPALLIINQTMKARYYGKKDLHSLARFYQKTTGFDPVKDFLSLSSSGWVNTRNENTQQLWYQVSSWREMSAKEPYMLFAISFLILRAFLHFCPRLFRGLAALWNTCTRHVNLGVFGESRQLLGRVMQIIDVAWNKLKWCKTRNFPRVWASSLASVSLGETSSA